MQASEKEHNESYLCKRRGRGGERAEEKTKEVSNGEKVLPLLDLEWSRYDL